MKNNKTYAPIYKGEAPRALAMPSIPAFDPSVTPDNQAYLDSIHRLELYAAVNPADIHVAACKTVYGTLRKLTANSGIMARDARPTWASGINPMGGNNNGSYDPNTRLYQHRRDIAAMVDYWEQIDRLTDIYQESDTLASMHVKTAKAYRQAAAAAKRAGDMATWGLATHNAKLYEDVSKIAHKKAVEANTELMDILTNTIGDGMDLYQLAYAYLWERLTAGYTLNSLFAAPDTCGRWHARTVAQWVCVLVRRAIHDNARIEGQTAGYSNLETAEAVDSYLEGETVHAYKRTPHYWDTTSTADTDTPVETLDKVNGMVAGLGLSVQQSRILKFRLQGLSLDDIAGRLGCAKGSINVQMRRIRDKARQMLPAETLEKYGIK